MPALDWPYPYSKSTRLVMRCRQQQSDESHPCSISSRSSRHARIPFHLNPSARPRYQTWTRSCWSFHDDRYDRARGLSRSGAPFGQQLPGRGRGPGGTRSLCSHTDISSCRLTWHPGSLAVGTLPTGVHGAESMQALYTAQYGMFRWLHSAQSGDRLRPPTATAAWPRRSKLRGRGAAGLGHGQRCRPRCTVSVDCEGCNITSPRRVGYFLGVGPVPMTSSSGGCGVTPAPALAPFQ